MTKRQAITAALLTFCMMTGSAQAYFRDSVYIPDIETFMQIGSNGGPQVSAAGNVICFTSAMSGVGQVYRLRDNGWPEQLTYFTDGVDFYALSHDGRWIIVGADWGGSEETNLHLVEVATGRTEPLTNVKDVQIADPVWSYDNRRIYYRTNEANGKDFHIYEMDVVTRATRPILAQEGYHSPQVVARNGRYLVAARYPSNVNSDLYLVDLTSGVSEHLTPHEGNALFSAYEFTPDYSALYIISNNNKEGIGRRAKLDLKSKAITEMDPGTRWEAEGMTFSEDMSRMAWIVNEDGYGRLHLWDLAANAELPAPPVDGLVSGGMFMGNDTFIFSFNGPDSPPDCWRWEIGAKKLTQLTFAVTAGIDRRIFVKPELVRFPSFDGLEISGFLYLPPGAKKGDRVPFIISAHGGPESQFRPDFIRNFQYFALNGFGIFALNPRGSSGYGRDFLDMDNYKDRWKSVKDYETATRWLAEQGYADPKRIAITGGSYGGYMTLACITANPDLYAAACDQVGIANFVTFLKNTAPYRRHLRESEYGPLADSAFLWEISPLAQVDKIRTPLLIVHGENDPRVPVGEARQMARAIAARGGIVDTLIFPDEGHGVAKRPNVLVTYRRIVDFFKKYLLAPSPEN
ncbi:MAG TPA: S9 family peptidase [bacterium]|nr:S9 family peptidase [bacterium]